MKPEVWNAQMRLTLRNCRLDMIELLLQENEIHKIANNPGENKDESEILEQHMKQILGIHAKLHDLQEQYALYWSKYQKKNKNFAELVKCESKYLEIHEGGHDTEAESGG